MTKYADKLVISTVIRNLVTNAIKYSNPGGGIIVNTAREDNVVVFILPV